MELSRKKSLLGKRKCAPCFQSMIAVCLSTLLILSLSAAMMPGIGAGTTDGFSSDEGTLELDDDTSSPKIPSQATQDPIKNEETSSPKSDPDDSSPSSPPASDSISGNDIDEKDSTSLSMMDDDTIVDDSLDGSLAMDDATKIGSVDATDVSSKEGIYVFEITKEEVLIDDINSSGDSTSLYSSNETDKSVTLVSTIGTVSENKPISVRTSSEQQSTTIIRQVDFATAATKNNVSLRVTNHNEKPIEVINEIQIQNTTSIYKYLDIKLTANDEYIGESGIKWMNFTFDVDMSWIEDHHIDIATITMMRYHNDSWQKLNTTVMNETTTYIALKAETSGLSIFAVVGDTIVEDSDEIVRETIQLPWWTPLSVIMFSTVCLGIILVKKRYIYFN